MSLVVAPHLHGRTSMMEHGGHGPVWHFDEQTWSHDSRGRMHIELHVGIRSEHDVRDRTALGGNEEADEGSNVCLPQGQ